jgi:LmbE family N-acetylglucosaminyl deacetylase
MRAMSPRALSSLTAVLVLLLAAAAARAQEKARIICFGAHPDDCDIKAGGVAVKWAAAGYPVKFVSVTNGHAGHQKQGGRVLAARRRAEAAESGRRAGITYDVLDHPDGELTPSLQARRAVIRQIRSWRADLVLSPRTNDYHPDHRYTAVLVQDAAYLVTVPNLVPEVPALRRNPVFAYLADPFRTPAPFRPDVVVAIDDVLDRKLDMLDAHRSQFYEWMPWHAQQLDQVPADPAARRSWLATQWPGYAAAFGLTAAGAPWRTSLRKRYEDRAAAVRDAEAFEIAEYGRQPDEDEIRRLFPFF